MTRIMVVMMPMTTTTEMPKTMAMKIKMMTTKMTTTPAAGTSWPAPRACDVRCKYVMGSWWQGPGLGGGRGTVPECVSGLRRGTALEPQCPGTRSVPRGREKLGTGWLKDAEANIPQRHPSCRSLGSSTLLERRPASHLRGIEVEIPRYLGYWHAGRL